VLKRILTLAVAVTLLAGFYLFPAEANTDKLQRILQITGLPAEQRDGLKARLDRDMLVYGSPSDIPDNDWKPASTSWQEANGINLGKPGNQEPRFLGKTAEGDNLASDYFPDDAPNHIAPARRDMIKWPWERGLSYGTGLDVSDYTWGVIAKALSTYHERVGHSGPGNGFAANPAFRTGFNKDTLKDHFLVMAEPKPGMAGAVSHWHNRADLGGVWYDPIFIRWDILPNFMVESIDPGTDKAQPGQTYTGRVVLKAKPDGSFLSDPVTSQLFSTLGMKLELSQDYTVPFGVAVNGQLVSVKNFTPVSGMENIYQYKVPAGTTESTLEFTFQWTAPVNISSDKITLATGVNESITVLPKDVWGYMEWSEITNIDNVKAVEVAAAIPDLSTNLETDSFTGVKPGEKIASTVAYKLDKDHTKPERALLRLRHVVGEEEYPIRLQPVNGAPAPDANGYITLKPGDVMVYEYTYTVQSSNTTIRSRINPVDTNQDTDWSNNRAEASVIIPQYDIKVEVRPEKDSYTAINGGNAGLNFIIRVSRKDDIPGEIKTTGYFEGFNGKYAGRHSMNTTLGPGEYKERKYGFPAPPGSYTTVAEAWPEGFEDAFPADNLDESTVYVGNQIFKPDSKIRVDLIDGGPIYR